MRERAMRKSLSRVDVSEGQKLGLDKEEIRTPCASWSFGSMSSNARRWSARSEYAGRREGRSDHDDVKKYFDEHAEMISTDLHLGAIRFSNEDEARSSLEQIKSGTPFDTVAKEKSPSAPKGKTAPWDMGYLHWNQIPIEWVDAVYALKKDEVSGVLSSKRSGVFIVKIFDRKKNPDAAFGRMSASIMNRLRDLRVMQDYDRYIDALKNEAKIVKHEERRKAS
jgi:parvulin-like peptidyl-prolyl isomerase